MASRYNNNDESAPLLVCPQRAGKWSKFTGRRYIRSYSQNRYDRRNALFVTLFLGINQCKIYASRKSLSIILSLPPLSLSFCFYSSILKTILTLRHILSKLNILCLQKKFYQSLKIISCIKEQKKTIFVELFKNLARYKFENNYGPLK